MPKTNCILREILYRNYELNEPFMSQKSLAEACDLSSETVNRLVTKLSRFKAIKKRPQGFRVTNAKKILEYWAATRDLHEDIVWATHSAFSLEELESELPGDSVLTGFSGFRRRFERTPVPYRRVHAYGSPSKIKNRFSESEDPEGNLVILEADSRIKELSSDKAAPLGQIYVDLWQIGTSATGRYLQELEEKLEPKPHELLRDLAQKGPRT